MSPWGKGAGGRWAQGSGPPGTGGLGPSSGGLSTAVQAWAPRTLSPGVGLGWGAPSQPSRPLCPWERCQRSEAQRDSFREPCCSWEGKEEEGNRSLKGFAMIKFYEVFHVLRTGQNILLWCNFLHDLSVKSKPNLHALWAYASFKTISLSTLLGNLCFFLIFIIPAETKSDLIAQRIIFLLLLIISNNYKKNSCTVTYVHESIYLKIFILYKWQYSVKAEL